MMRSPATQPSNTAKYLTKNIWRPDNSFIIQTQQIKSSPKFAKLVSFALNIIVRSLERTNPRRLDNQDYLYKENVQKDIIQVLYNHIANDDVLYTTANSLIACLGDKKDKNYFQNMKIVIDSNCIEACNAALYYEANKSDHTIKALMDVITLLSSVPGEIGKLIGRGGVDSLLKTFTDQNAKPDIINHAMKCLIKIAQTDGGQEALIERNIIKDLVTELKRNGNHPDIIRNGLNLMNLLTKQKKAVLELQKIGVQSIIEIIESNPNDKQVLNYGGNILSKVAVVADLRQTLHDLKNSKDLKKREQAISLLSNLVMVDEMIEEMVRQNAVGDLLGIEKDAPMLIKTDQNNIKIVKHAATALGRLAETDNSALKQIVEEGGIEAFMNLLKLNDFSVQKVGVDSLQKIIKTEPSNIEKLQQQNAIPEVIQCIFNEQSESLEKIQLSESAIGLLSIVALNENAKQNMIEKGIIPRLVNTLQNHKNHKKNMEQALKLLGLLADSEESVTELQQYGALEVCASIVSENLQWRKCALYTVNLVDAISEDPKSHKKLRDIGVAQAVVTILSDEKMNKMRKVYDQSSDGYGNTSSQLIDQQSNNNNNNNNNEDQLNPKQELEIQNMGQSILEKLLNVDDILKVIKELNELNGQFNEQKPEQKIFNEIKPKLALLSHACTIPKLAQFALENNSHKPVLGIAKKLNNSNKDLEGKSQVVSDTFNFLSTQSELNNNPETKPLYINKTIGPQTLDFINEMLKKNDSAPQVIPAFQGVDNMLRKKLASELNQNEKRGSFLNVRAGETNKILEGLIQGIISNIKKYPENEPIQIEGPKILSQLAEISPELTNTVLGQGATRLTLSKLEDPSSSKPILIENLKLLNSLSRNKEGLVMMVNQKAMPTVMSMLNSHQNDQELAQAATPLLKQLANLENSDLNKDFEKDLEEIIKTEDPLNKGFNKVTAAECLELQGNFSLVDKNVPKIVEKGGVPVLARLLKNESKDYSKNMSPNKLGEQNRIIDSTLTNLSRIANSPVVHKTNALDQFKEEGVILELIKIMKEKQNHIDGIKGSVSLLDDLLNKQPTRDEVIKQAIKDNIAPALIQLLDTYKDNPEVTRELNKLINDLSRASPEITQNLGDPRLIKNLIKEAKQALKDDENPQSLAIATQNLQCLNTLAGISENIPKIANEGGNEFMPQVIKKMNRKAELFHGLEQDQENTEKLNLNFPQERKARVKYISTNDLKDVTQQDLNDAIAVNAFDILNKLAKEQKNSKNVLNDQNVKEVINSLKVSPESEPIVRNALDILKKAAKQEPLKQEILENQGVEAIMGAMNTNPTNQEIRDKSGEILKMLGGDQNIDEIAEQFLELAKEYNPQKQSTADPVKSSINYLGNLYAIPEAQEPTEQNLEQAENIVEGVGHVMQKSKLQDVQIIAPSALLLSNLARQSEPHRQLVQNSQAFHQLQQLALLEDPDILGNHESGVSNIVADTLVNAAGDPQRIKKQLDPDTGIPINNYETESSSQQQQPKNNQKIIEDTSDNLNSLITPENAVENPNRAKRLLDLFNTISKDPKMQEGLKNSETTQNLADLWENLNKKETPELQKICGRVPNALRHLVKDPETFNQVVKAGLLKDAIKNLKEAKVDKGFNKDVREGEFDKPDSALDLFQALSDNNVEKTPLLTNNVPQVIVDNMNKIMENPDQDFLAIPSLQKLLQKDLETLALMNKDPALSRNLEKVGAPQSIKKALAKLSDLSNLAKQKPELIEDQKFIQTRDGIISEPYRIDVDNTEPTDVDYIEGSSFNKEQLGEQVLGTIADLTSTEKGVKKLDPFNPSENVIDNIKNVIKNEAHDPVIVTHGLKALDNILKAIPEDYKLGEQAKLDGVNDTAQKVAKLYPNILIIQKLADNINQKIKKSKQKEEPQELELKEEDQSGQGVPEIKKGGGDNLQTALLNLIQQKPQVAGEQAKAQEQTNAKQAEPEKLQKVTANYQNYQELTEGRDQNGQGEELQEGEVKHIDLKPAAMLPEDFLDKVDLVADSLEELTQKAEQKTITPEEKDLLKKILEAVLDLSNDQNNHGTLQNLGILDNVCRLGKVEDLLKVEDLPKEHKNDCAQIIANMTTNDDIVQQLEGSLNLVEAILKQLKEIQDTPETQLSEIDQENAEINLATVQNLSNNPQIMKNLVDGGFIPTMCKVVDNHPKNLEMNTAAIETLAQISQGKDIIDQVVLNNGPNFSTGFLKDNKGNINALIAVSHLIGKLAINPQAQEQFAKNGVIPQLLEGLYNNKDNVDVVANTIYALGNLAQANKNNQQQIMDYKPILQDLAEILEKHVNEPVAMENTNNLINALVFRNTPNKEEIGKTDVIPKLIKQHKVYSQNNEQPNVLKNNLKALGNLSSVPDNGKNIVDNGFIPQVNSFIQKYGDEPKAKELVKTHLQVLGALGINPNATEQVMKQGGPDAAIAALNKNLLNPEILTAGVDTLNDLLTSKENAETIAKKGAIESDLKILKSQDFDAKLVPKVLNQLHKLTAAQDNIQKIVNQGGHETLVDILNNHPENAEVIEADLKLLSRMANTDPNCKKLHEGGLTQAGLNLLENGNPTQEQTQEILNLLSKLSQNQQAAHVIGEQGAHSVVKTIDQNMKNPKIVEKGVALQNTLLTMESNIEPIVNNGGVNSLNNVLQKHPDNKQIIQQALQALSAVGMYSEEMRDYCNSKGTPNLIKILATSDDFSIQNEAKMALNHFSLPQKIDKADGDDLIEGHRNLDTLITKDIRNFLVAGKVLKIYKKNGDTKEFHIFLTNDLKEILCKKPKESTIKQKWRLPIHQVKYIETTFDNDSPFAKSKGLFKKPPDSKNCFAIIGPTSLEGQRSFYCSAPSGVEAKKWIDYLSIVLKDLKLQQKNKV